MLLTIEEIKQLVNNNTIYGLGLDYYKENLVKSVSTQFNKNLNCTIILAEVAETRRLKYNVVLMYSEEAQKFISLRCDCFIKERVGNPCEHIAAALIAIYYKENPQEKVAEIEKIEIKSEDNYSRVLIKQYNKEYENSILVDYQLQLINIVPSIEILPTMEWVLTFKIGDKKLYSIKNLEVFKETIQKNEYHAYGKELNFIHHIDNFTNPALVLYIMREYKNREYLKNVLKAAYDVRYIYLNKTSVDEFFWRFVKDRINFKFRGEEVTLIKDERLPHINMTINKVDDHYELMLTNKMYYIEGAIFGYYISNGTLYYTPSNFHKACSKLLTYFNKNDVLIVEEAQMKDFYNSVLIEILGYIQFNGNLDEYLPSDVVSRLYVDIDKDCVNGFLVHFYDETHKYLAFKDEKEGFGRNVREEMKAKIALKKYITSVDDKSGYFNIKRTMNDVYDFLSDGINELSSYCEIYASEKVRKINFIKKTKFGVGVRMEGDLLKLNFTSDLINKDELADVLKAYKAKKKYFKLKSGEIIQLKGESLEELSNIVDSLHVKEDAFINGSISVDKYRSLSLDSTLKASSIIELDRDDYYKQIVKAMKSVQDAEYPVPESMKKILRNYQKLGFRWLKTMSAYGFGGILADDMGIGKTIQVIALFEDLKINKPGTKSLVICPASLILNWEAEIIKFSKIINPFVVLGAAEERMDIILKGNDADVWITSYDYLKRDYEYYTKYDFEYMIVDEAQYIKNQNTKNAISVKQIKAKHKFALTGTPIENSLSELWSIFDYLMPNYLFDYGFFKKHYENPIVKFQDDALLKDLKNMVEPFILRRVKKDVLKELPDKIEQTILIDFDEESKRLYDANINLIRNDLEKQYETGSNNKILVIAMLTKLRQLCCAPQLLYDDFLGEAVKLSACMDLVRNCKQNKKKVLIFSQFTSLLHIIQTELIKENVTYYLLTGETSKNERQSMVNSFNQDDTDAFLISLKAGGTGLNLTGAEVVIHFDPWWNLSAQNQATDRAHRFGQDKNVQVYKLIVRNTIEEKIMNLQEKKKDLSEAIINENEGVITSMSKDDILELFK